MPRLATSFQNAMYPKLPAAFAMTIRLLKLHGPCPLSQFRKRTYNGPISPTERARCAFILISLCLKQLINLCLKRLMTGWKSLDSDVRDDAMRQITCPLALAFFRTGVYHKQCWPRFSGTSRRKRAG